MSHGWELDFLCDTLQKCHIQTRVISHVTPASKLMDSRVTDVFGIEFAEKLTVYDYLGRIETMTQYRFTDPLKLCYIYFLLPNDTKSILFIGPYLSSRLSTNDILELGEKVGVSPNAQKNLEEFYLSLPLLPENDHIFTMIDTFCENIWQSPSFAIVEANTTLSFPVTPIGNTSHAENAREILSNAKMIEARYAFENSLLQAVELGQLHKENLLSVLGDQLFEQRLSDPIRNAKNYSIIMNTLLRKAAEQGGVHPIYIDSLSSSFATKIEQIRSPKENSTLMKEMFSSYCRLVHQHSTKKYSQAVQKALMIIDTDLSLDLTLNTLAEHLELSPGYLATVFKKEVGKTVSEYVRDKRIAYAKYLLETSQLQIQTVALHCGVMDVQYFSKIFKKQVGKTPLEYRKSLSGNK